MQPLLWPGFWPGLLELYLGCDFYVSEGGSPKSGTPFSLDPYPPCLVGVRAYLCSDLILGFAGQRPPWTSCEYLPPSGPSQVCTFPEQLSLKPIFSGIAQIMAEWSF